MNKTLPILLLTIILLAIQATAFPNINIENEPINNAVIKEFTDSATFKLDITNNGLTDTFTIYSLVGVKIEPREIGSINSGETKTITITATPNENLREIDGPLVFEYRIKDSKQDESYKSSLTINMVPIDKLIEVTSTPLTPTKEETTLTITNTQNIQLDNIKLNFESLLFTSETEISLGPEESKEFTLPINKETGAISAGQYIITTNFEIENKTGKTEGILEYSEEESIASQESTSGSIIRKTVVTKENRGNTQSTASVKITKNAISRLFTINSPSALTTIREGFAVTYTWQKTLGPGETFVVETTTNYTFPLIILIIIIAIAVVTRIYSKRTLVLKKKVSLVRTKNREFALKVTIHAKALKHIDDVQIIDHLPAMTKLYEKFGKRPDKIDPATRRLFWNIEKLNRGEARIFSYIIYSKLNIVGRFELPAAHATFSTEEGKQVTHSNNAFFSNEKEGRF